MANNKTVNSLFNVVYAKALKRQKLTQVRTSSGTDIYQHMPTPHPHAARFHEQCMYSVTFTSAHLYSNVYKSYVGCRVPDVKEQVISTDAVLSSGRKEPCVCVQVVKFLWQKYTLSLRRTVAWTTV